MTRRGRLRLAFWLLVASFFGGIWIVLRIVADPDL